MFMCFSDCFYFAFYKSDLSNINLNPSLFLCLCLSIYLSLSLPLRLLQVLKQWKVLK